MVQIIILLNSTDVVTGSAFETQASFTLANIKWDAMAKPCVFPDKIDNKVRAALRSCSQGDRCYFSRGQCGCKMWAVLSNESL